jgi:hypothetical protein
MSNSVFLTPHQQDLIELDRGLLANIERYRFVEERLAEQSAGSILDHVRDRLQQLESEHEQFRRTLKSEQLLPHAPETDLEDFKRIAAAVRAWIETDQSQVLLNWLIETEEDWQSALDDFEAGAIDRSRIHPLRVSAKQAIRALSEHKNGD